MTNIERDDAIDNLARQLLMILVGAEVEIGMNALASTVANTINSVIDQYPNITQNNLKNYFIILLSNMIEQSINNTYRSLEEFPTD